MGTTATPYLALLSLVCAAAMISVGRVDASLAPGLFILGDSTVDTGNQNYITSVIKSNFAPYGKDFTPPGPTGRFCNGKLANDYIAEYLGLPAPVNFLAPSATGSALLTGVNLASSGSGYLDITGQLVGVVNLTKQLDNLGEVQSSIIQQIGLPATMDLFSNSIFLISTGSNDFVNNYNLNPILQEKYNPQQWQQLLLDSFSKNLMTLYGYGARMVLVDSLAALGCVPEQLNLFNSKDGKCLESVNGPLKSFNLGLSQLLQQLHSEMQDYKLFYVNTYDFIFESASNPPSHGFVYGNTACCGEGPYKGLPCANPISDVCSNADEYVFWDLFHPTQRTYQQLASSIISGDQSQIYPYNLQTLLQMN